MNEFWALISTKIMNIAHSLKNLKDKLKQRTIKLEGKLFFQRSANFLCLYTHFKQ